MKKVYVNIPLSESPYLQSIFHELGQMYEFIYDSSHHHAGAAYMKFSNPQGLFRQLYKLECLPNTHLPSHLKCILLGQSLHGDIKTIKEILQILPDCEEQKSQVGFVGGQNIQAVAFASSTGGPQALMKILPLIPDFVKIPIFITQHMQSSLLSAFCTQLSEVTPLRNVYLAEEGMLITPKSVYIAPGDRHLMIKKSEHACCCLSSGPLINYVRPAADPMFESLSENYPIGSMLGVILTGMGQDGVNGARSIVARKGAIIAQDEATSVVWGMPKAVIDAKLAHYILPLERIGEVIGNLCQLSKEKYHD
ncbi:MAG: Protein-glutamate methylesterase/protein-glutamine glutaminase [Holosporales bacterium]